MQDADDSDSLLDQCSQDISQGKLMPHIQTRGWFVEQKKGRLLGQRAGKHHPLEFTTGQGGDLPVGELRDFGQLHGLINDLLIFYTLTLPTLKMRRATQGDDFSHVKRKRQIRALREESKLFGPFPAGPLIQDFPGE